MGKFDALLKALGVAAKDVGDDAAKVLAKVDSPELAVSLKGKAREQYLKALDEVQGKANKRASNFYVKHDYKDMHTAPQRGTASSPLSNLTEQGTFPNDIYSDKAARYYGHGDKNLDSNSIKIIQSKKGKPDELVTIYRSAPKNIEEINPGDWVSINKDYAARHGESRLGEDYNLLQKDVPASDVYNAGDIHEFGYAPDAMERSKDAAFDLRFKDSPLLMAGAGAVPMAGADVNPIEPLKAVYGYYDKLKNMFTDPLAEQLDLTKDRSAKEGIKSTLNMAADPINLVPGAPGLALGLGQAVLTPEDDAKKRALDKLVRGE